MADYAPLIQGSIKGRRSDQAALYNLLAPKMMVVCLRYSKTKEEAEDILQDGFIKVFAKIKQYSGEGNFEGWVRKVMVNTALQKYRSQKTLQPIVNIDGYSQYAESTDYILPRLDAKELLALIQNLPPAYRMVFNLYAFEGMKHREIADMLGISEGTSKSNLFNARALLQRAVESAMQVGKLNNM